MPILTDPDGNVTGYEGPERTQAQHDASILFGTDEDARPGIASPSRPFMDFSKKHRLCAPAVIHDFLTLRPLTAEQRTIVDGNYDRDNGDVVAAIDEPITRAEYQIIAVAFDMVVGAYRRLGLAESNIDRTTPESRKDDDRQCYVACWYVNWCAAKTGKPLRYPIVDMRVIPSEQAEIVTEIPVEPAE